MCTILLSLLILTPRMSIGMPVIFYTTCTITEASCFDFALVGGAPEAYGSWRVCVCMYGQISVRRPTKTNLITVDCRSTRQLWLCHWSGSNMRENMKTRVLKASCHLPVCHHRYFRLRKRDWKRATHAKSRCTFMREPSMLEWLAPSWRSLLDLGRRVGEGFGERAESSEHGSTKFCAFCLSTITEYSRSCLPYSKFVHVTCMLHMIFTATDMHYLHA